MTCGVETTVEKGPAWSRPASICLLGAALALVGCAHGAAASSAAMPATAAAAPAAAAQGGAAAAGDAESMPSDATASDATASAEAQDGATHLGRAASTAPDLSDLEEPPQPPDGKWLRDESGHEYFIAPLSKSEEWYWTTPAQDWIRCRKYEMYLVDHQDDDNLYVRRYRRTGLTTSNSFEPTAEEMAKIEASYVTETGEADRFRLLSFGAGLPQRGQWRNGFDVADMNGDGQLDVVHGPPRKMSDLPVILLGDGAGHWHGWAESRYPSMVFSYGDAAAADFDGDGVEDMALGMHVQGVTVLRGDGAGGFTRWDEGMDYWEKKVGGDPGFSSRAIEVVDWNQDGRPDVLALGEGPRPARDEVRGAPALAGSAFGVALYLNQGDGTWSRHVQGADSQLFGDSVAVGDFNADGRLDFATGSNTNGLHGIVHFGEADGTWRTQEVDALRSRVLVRSVAAADLDGDGRSDLAVAYSAYEGRAWHGGIDLLYARDGETWERVPLRAMEGRESFYAVAAGDLDGDGRPEVVALDGSGGTEIYSATPAGWVRELSPELPAVEQGCRGYRVRLVDLNGDGRDEMVEEFAGEPSALFAPLSCRSQGSLRAWTVDPASQSAAP